MGIFYDRRPDIGPHIETALADALAAVPSGDPARDAAEAKSRTAELTQTIEAQKPPFHAWRVWGAVAIAAALIIGAVVLSIMTDNQAINEAAKVAANPNYKSPDLTGLKGVADWLRTLGAAWSAGLVSVLLSEKASA